MENINSLYELTESRNGYSFERISPFFIHQHIHELLDKAKEGLTIYTELQKITSVENTERIINTIKKSVSEEDARNTLMNEFSISELTAQNLLDTPLDELSIFGAFDYLMQVEIYREAVSHLECIAEKQKELDKLAEES